METDSYLNSSGFVSNASFAVVDSHFTVSQMEWACVPYHFALQPANFQIVPIQTQLSQPQLPIKMKRRSRNNKKDNYTLVTSGRRKGVRSTVLVNSCAVLLHPMAHVVEQQQHTEFVEGGGGVLFLDDLVLPSELTNSVAVTKKTGHVSTQRNTGYKVKHSGCRRSGTQGIR